MPEPRKLTYDGKSLSVVLAPTVKIHGATLVTVRGAGPSLPAEQTTVAPR